MCDGRAGAARGGHGETCAAAGAATKAAPGSLCAGGQGLPVEEAQALAARGLLERYGGDVLLQVRPEFGNPLPRGVVHEEDALAAA